MPKHAVDPSVIKIDASADARLDDFALATLRDRYLLPHETSPQQAFARAAAAFADNKAHAQRLYNYASKGWFTFATPLLTNGGSDRGLPISCFLTTVEDSREGIFDHYAEVGWLSSVGGGVGSYYGALRSAGEKTSRGSSSTGIIPFIAVDDRLILSVSQGGTRRGSHAVYLDISHPEIREFTVGRKSGDANRKFMNLHNAVNITDEFMEAVYADGDFDLRSPKTGEVIETVKARELWLLILETRKQTGEPYLHFIDTSNRYLPQSQKDLGLSVKQSNLCVAGHTEVLTRYGFRPIEGLEGIAVDVWNGEEWSTVEVVKTAERTDFIRVIFDDGGCLDCTPDHKFYLADGTEVRAADLKDGAVLECPNLPTVEGVQKDFDLDKAYTAGWATMAGFENNNRLTVHIPDTVQTGFPEAYDAVIRRLGAASSNVVKDAGMGGLTLSYEPLSISAGYVPLGLPPKSKRAWLSGAVDAIGEAVAYGDETWIAVASQDNDLIWEMRLLALELGLHPHIRRSGTTAAILFCPADVWRMNTTIWAHRPTVAGGSGRYPSLQPKVATIQDLPFYGSSYCFKEPLRGRGVFNGYLTGQCTEITLATGIDKTGRKRTAVCCLSSLNAALYREWQDDKQFILDIMRMLDNVLDEFIRLAPPQLANAVYSATQERSVGLGVLGFHTLLQKEGIAFESTDARILNVMMFAQISADANFASKMLGEERGEAPDMKGTGHRFAHRMAIAPNASSSIFVGASPSCEPNRANVYLHKTLDGSFTVKNRELEAALELLGVNTLEVWKSIIAHEGSVQHLGIPDETKAVFKTAMELDQRWVVQHAADRQGFIDQAQSTNLFFDSDADASYVNATHFLAWKLGLKSLYYYRSTTAKRAENVESKIEKNDIVDPFAGLGALVDNAATDDGCVACEG